MPLVLIWGIDVKQHALFNSKACATGVKEWELIELTNEYHDKTKNMRMEMRGLGVAITPHQPVDIEFLAFIDEALSYNVADCTHIETI